MTVTTEKNIAKAQAARRMVLKGIRNKDAELKGMGHDLAKGLTFSFSVSDVDCKRGY